MKLVAKVWKAHIFNIKQNHSYQAATTKSKHRLHAHRNQRADVFPPNNYQNDTNFTQTIKKKNSLKEKSNKVLCKKSSSQFHKIKHESLGKRDKGEKREI